MSERIELAHALADGALDPEESAAALEALRDDPNLRAEYEWARLLKAELKSCARPIDEGTVWQDVRRRLDAIDRTRSAEGFVGRYAWAFCALFIAFIAAGAVMNRIDGAQSLSSAHVAGLLGGLKPVSVEGPGQAIAMVREKVGKAPCRVQDVPAVVTGAAYGYIDDRRAAQIALRDGQGPVEMFVIERTRNIEGVTQADDRYMVGSLNGTPAIAWCDDGYLVLLVGPRPAADLQRLASSIRAPR